MMDGFKRFRTWILAALLAGAALATGYGLRGLREGKDDKGEAAEPAGVVAAVRTVPLGRGPLADGIQAFGAIVPAPGAARTISAPSECRVVSIAVREGQLVAAGTPILTVSDSPESRLALDQARIDARAAESLLRQAQDRHRLKLADNASLAQAQQTRDSAQARLESLEARHRTVARELRAQTAGVVLHIPVQVGALVPAGGSLAELADPARLEARLGIDPGQAKRLRSGTELKLSAVDGGAGASAKVRIRVVSPAINPTTRLSDVFLALPDRHPFLLGQWVEAKLPFEARQGWIVPYAAVQPDDGQAILFTVRKGHAVRHAVQVLLQSGDRVEISAPDLDPSEPVVVQGNYELQDGMAVRTEAGR